MPGTKLISSMYTNMHTDDNDDILLNMYPPSYVPNGLYFVSYWVKNFKGSFYMSVYFIS